MNIERYLDVTDEIKRAISDNRPVVALESTILSHGMPYPENVEFAKKVEKIIRDKGAVPATAAIINGRLKLGLSEDELALMCEGKGIGKVSRRDLAVYVAEKKTGATTVASTMMLADFAGIKVFSTGGIGGVHRGAETTFDISADLQELAHTPVAVVCAGAKSILDLDLTLEYLETFGVPTLGYKTDNLPAFFCRNSGRKLDVNCSSAAEIASIINTQWELGMSGGALVCNPIPEEFSLDFNEMEKVIEKALDAAKEKGIRGKDTTPFLLAKIKELTGGESFASNLELAYNNARLASDVAIEYCKLR